MRFPSRILALGWSLSLVGLAWAEKSPGVEWPLKYVSDVGTATVYQPQLESFKDNKVTGRSAVSVLMRGSKEPWFGAVWMEGRVTTDRETGLVTVESVQVTDVKAPEVPADGVAKLKKFLSEQLTQSRFVIPLAQLTASLETMENKGPGDTGLSTTPPEILFRTKPAVLLIMDGDPKTQPIQEGKLLQVVNTAEVLVQVSTGSFYYLWTPEGWIGADKLEGPWSRATAVPAPVEELGKKLTQSGPPPAKNAKKPSGAAPEVVIRHEPAELFVSKGQPQFEPLKGVNLLHVANSDQNILMDIKSQDIYVVASGRWYKSKKTEGPWTYVAADKLPEDFAKIPANSSRAGVLPFIAGTPQAREAVLDASVPQTAAVKKGPADVKVVYDGAPKWKAVEGMEKNEVAYAENTADAIFKVKNRYYLCKEAVWYEAAQPEGPWSVAVSIPSELNKLPPSTPNYQSSYVYIYESTPEVVYVGYTPGYMGCYVYGPTVVYGTGFYYPPYYGYGGAYYGRPMTYGYHAYYNPATGWGAVGYHGPNGGIAVSGPVGGWGRPGGPNGIGGPGGPGGAGGVGGIGGPGKPGNVGARPTPTQGGSKQNLYNQANRGGGAPVKPTARPSGPAPSAGAGSPSVGSRPANTPLPAGGKNNMYADPSGNVHRQNSSGGWESQSGGKWSPAPSSNGNRNSDLNRQSQMRQSSSSSGYSGSRGSGGSYSGSRGGGYSGSRGGGGGSRGGGGGRR
ncbi:MAG: hypothetical protein IPP35_01270 [Elusimicrobia bacterium]|nr:hypothetical protein [Elusimicrobiota bacterium]